MLTDVAHSVRRHTNSTGLARCVYCHNPSNLEAPGAGGGCKLEHFGTFVNDGIWLEYRCCGARMYIPEECGSDDDGEGYMRKYCWEGIHRAVPVREEMFGLEDSEEEWEDSEEEREDDEWLSFVEEIESLGLGGRGLERFFVSKKWDDTYMLQTLDSEMELELKDAPWWRNWSK